MDIHLRRVAFGVGESDFVALLHQGANRNRQLVEIVASAGINLAIFQWQAATARDQHQDFSFCCHFVLLSEIESASRKLRLYRAIAGSDTTKCRADCPRRALTVFEGRALSDLDDVTVRVADVAANLAVLGNRRREELGSPAFP